MGSTTTAVALNWVEQGYVPDRVVRLGIQRLLKERLAEIHADDGEAAAVLKADFIASMRAAPMAPLPELANAQHYEVPAAFFAQVLGPHRKYSCCHWGPGVETLEAAEAEALRITCERAGLEDGQDVLELGCGWGSLSLWMAEHYPRSRITALSNSASQRAYIEAEAARRGLGNLRVLTRDINDFDTAARHDRIVSVEMFEHLRNWPEAFRRVAGWLKPGGRFFMHVFVHRDTPYAFTDRDASDWMSRQFFSGGMMPSDDLALHFQDDLKLLQRWRWDGRHYQRTAEAWLALQDARRAAVRPVLAEAYGEADADLWHQRWRLFFLAVAELFGHDRGQTWAVGHYLFERRG
ncbi:cyclopropane-fatty-acyl-phospholipid synthase family protein [Piscinibacter sakaiensis]|uniref:Cyclopropane-fatty-acyl-phospholipid synthase-like protein n=1 Tax=Piscinibacter sakaiensis TaxID=1547922 RepID=A0A0K8P8L0_PISS1|nr:cyclopropane-fatty-acyl-phospholipid synthase family protein [Piscinibacter sakaiensis]GAP38844.1 cyclopropane-fatty-acyl-phospholipid synthase-like protein [Piscinibacter sakaiensis]